MKLAKTVYEPTQPFLPWQSVLGHSVRRLLATHDGTEGAGYAKFGIEFDSGDVLNVQNPEVPYEIDQ